MPLWTPDRITTALWLDAADASTITESDGAVSQWADKSGNGHHAAQAVANQRPIVIANQVNGMPVVRFDGDDDVLSSPLQVPIDDCAVFVVYKARLANTNYAIGMRPAADKRLYISTALHAKGAYMPTYTNSTDWRIAVVGGTSTQAYSGLDGVSSSGADTNTGLTENTWIGGANFIATDNLVSAYGLVDIAEALITTFSIDFIDTVEGYLAHKWGLAANLPAEHPYKDAAPIVLGLFDGTIADKDGSPAERRITVLDAAGHCVATDTSDPVTGAYSIAVPAESPYTLVFDGEPDRNAIVYANVIPGEVPE